jgi:hypothetical protein
LSGPLRFLEQHALLPAEPGQPALRCLRRRLKRLRGFYPRRNGLDLRKPIDQSRVHVIRAREGGLLSWNLLQWLVWFRIAHDGVRKFHSVLRESIGALGVPSCNRQRLTIPLLSRPSS